MKTIAFFIDLEEGHQFPSFALANELKEAGHRVVYWSIPDCQKAISAHGLAFEPVFADIYPLGYIDEYKQRKSQGQYHDERSALHYAAICRGELSILFTRWQPDILIVSAFFCIEALLLYYRYQIRSTIFTTYLRPPGQGLGDECLNTIMLMPPNLTESLHHHARELGHPIQSYSRWVAPLNELHQLVVCPAEFETRALSEQSLVHYLGPSVRQGEGIHDDNLLDHVRQGSKLIYCSLGSQMITYGEASKRFLHHVINMMRSPAMINYQLVVAVGAWYADFAQEDIPTNVHIQAWVSQVDVLKISSLAIIHGGLSSIKECVYHAVPMLVVPFRYDQPANAQRVTSHGIGRSIDFRLCTSPQLQQEVSTLIHDTTTQQRIRAMQSVFRHKQQSKEGQRVINQLLNVQATLSA